jgi:GH15 family glucan-1,4-alpha-glucosidase
MTGDFQPIEHHGVIGDLHTVALVAADGTIDFLCLPAFDSPSVFASLLDRERGGTFVLAPLLDGVSTKQLYLPDTNVLLTRFLADDGVAEVSDFMPIDDVGGPHVGKLVRRVKTVRGQVRFRMRCAPRFDYGCASHGARATRDGVLFEAREIRQALRLRAGVPLEINGGDAVAEFTLGADESAWFVLEQVVEGEAERPLGDHYVSEAFKATVNFWRAWANRSTYRGRWREMVSRSALTLKLLTSQEHGSIVAAPTFGLPEHVGGARNWDYRYTWIRDASFTLYALMRIGFVDEAAAFMRWIEARCREIGPEGSLQIMYAIDGRAILSESELEHWSGYRGSRPVRIGNAAHSHLQLDIYGELMDAVYLYDKYGSAISYDLWSDLVRLVDWVCANWSEPDESIWEVRGGRREFLYSRVLCWTALDRAMRLAYKRSFPAPLDRWREVRDAIHHDIFTRFWDQDRKAFVQHAGTRRVDAACLLMPLVRFISPTDPRWLSTLRAIEEDLVSDSLVFRYRLDDDFTDGVNGAEGTFCMCSFWYVECLSRMGDLHKARFLFEKMLGYASPLGLYGEELGPRGEHLGNFPQAFTHVALISAAFDLNRRLDAAGHPS